MAKRPAPATVPSPIGIRPLASCRQVARSVVSGQRAASISVPSSQGCELWVPGPGRWQTPSRISWGGVGLAVAVDVEGGDAVGVRLGVLLFNGTPQPVSALLTPVTRSLIVTVEPLLLATAQLLTGTLSSA